MSNEKLNESKLNEDDQEFVDEQEFDTEIEDGPKADTPKEKEKVYDPEPIHEYLPGVIKPMIHPCGTSEFTATRGPYSYRKYKNDGWNHFQIHKDGRYIMRGGKLTKIPDAKEVGIRIITDPKTKKKTEKAYNPRLATLKELGVKVAEQKGN